MPTFTLRFIYRICKQHIGQTKRLTLGSACFRARRRRALKENHLVGVRLRSRTSRYRPGSCQILTYHLGNSLAGTLEPCQSAIPWWTQHFARACISRRLSFGGCSRGDFLAISACRRHRLSSRAIPSVPCNVHETCRSPCLLMHSFAPDRHYGTPFYRLPSSASCTRRSASLFCSLEICVKAMFGKLATRKL